VKRNTARIGLLPLYLKLYDDTMPERRAEFEPFLAGVESGLSACGPEVIRADVCRVRAEFENAVAAFREADVDLVVTLHLAYSPSLESVDLLAALDIPILMLDTTMDAAFGPDVDASRIMYNHGIHGVQDLACMLRRRGKAYRIVAGHVTESNVLQRAADTAKAAYAARRFRATRALRVGPAFDGMGDFAVEENVLRETLGCSVDKMSYDALRKQADAVTDDAVEAEMAADREAFDVALDEEVHRRSVRAGLALRAALEQGGYDAFSVNFLAFQESEGPLTVMPFLEISKAMARGLGYSGEGDVFTAALVGALCCGFGDTTFTEIFCPDWAGNTIFLSHMGEINPEVLCGCPQLLEKPFPFTAALNPAFVTGALRPGPAVYVNLAPGPDHRYGIIAAPVEVLEEAPNPSMAQSVRGWIRPARPLADFLEQYSLNGGTHHSALVLGNRVEGIQAFAEFAGLECVVL
jgi:L-arabinose isomerase